MSAVILPLPLMRMACSTTIQDSRTGAFGGYPFLSE